METGFEDPLWSHRKQRKHQQARNISCPGMQLDDMMLVMESDFDFYRELNLRLWTALPRGEAVLKNWWFDDPVRRSLSVAKNHDVPAVTDRSHSCVNYIRGSAVLTQNVLHLFKCSSDQQIVNNDITGYKDVMPYSQRVVVLP